jgi:hypothetical protein
MTTSKGGRSERCGICGCLLHRGAAGVYASPTVQGRAHATMHHHVAERFFGRSKNRPKTVRERIFNQCPWEGAEGRSQAFCYECHEELLHNPVLLPADIQRFAALVQRAGLNEDAKPEGREQLAGRIALLHDVLVEGLGVLERGK